MPPAGHSQKSFNFIGVDVEALTYPEFFNYVDRWIANKNVRSHHIAIINAYCATEAFRNPIVARIYNQADLIGPDGMPFVYWLRWALKRRCDQFDASTIVLNLGAKSKEKGYKFYLYGGQPDVVIRMKDKLEELYPHIKIVGYQSPPFRPLTDEEDRSVCDEINSLKPDIICVGLGTPKQDYWIDDHIHKIKGAVFIPCGAIFDFFGGRIKKAPAIVSRLGAEWLYRLCSKDIKRLWHRYTVLNCIFLWNFFLQQAGYRQFDTKRSIRKEI
jgi:N-acetylglucosaminyldiphosphoundecaprenol N-acetyl-beta-D-mannosaminyltransferase